MKYRVVITGMGVVAPNAVGLDTFLDAIQKGKSGVTFHQKLHDLKFSCCIGGIPSISEELKSQYLTPLQLRGFDSAGILYGCIAGTDAWKDAGFEIDKKSPTDFKSENHLNKINFKKQLSIVVDKYSFNEKQSFKLQKTS